MNGREQKTDKDTCLQNDRAALESYAEGQTFLWMTEKGDTNITTGGAELFEYILSPANLNSAYKQVKRNNGSGGIDGMDTEALRLYLQTHRFVRYADDCMIFCRSEWAAARVLASITKYIEGTLCLKVNQNKTVVAHIKDVKFLGYGFYFTKDGCKIRIHRKSVEKMNAKIRELTCRSNGWGNERRKEALRQFITGWLNYFRLADMKILLE